jgi:hypothetical protein
MAATAGPVTIDTELLQAAGKVTVRVDPNCKQATMVVSTRDTEGTSAEAVQRATLTQNRDGVLSAKVSGPSNGGTTISGNGIVINGRGGGMTIGNISGGSISTGRNGIQISGYNGPITVNGVQINSNGSGVNVTPAASPIEITAVVPPGSALSARTQSADIEADGLSTVDARTQSGDVSVDAAWTVRADSQSGDVSVDWVQDLDAKTQSGDIRIGWAQGQVNAKSQSGDVQIQQFAGGSAQANSMSGNARVHVTAPHGDGPRIVRASSMSGNATITAENAQVEQNLNAQATSMTGRASSPRPAAARPLHQNDGSRQYNQAMPGRSANNSRGY